jgi:hypothetical protein
MKTLALLLLLVLAASTNAQTLENTSIEQRVRQIIGSLPKNSELRMSLEHGVRGNGVHEPWMDQMKLYGVRRAAYTLSYSWKHKRLETKFTKITYFTEYESHKSITSGRLLRRIKTERLEETLKNVVLKWIYARDNTWSPTYATTGEMYYVLYDDEALPMGEIVT